MNFMAENIEPIALFVLSLGGYIIAQKTISLRRDSMLISLHESFSKAQESYTNMAAKKYEIISPDTTWSKTEKEERYKKLLNQTRVNILNQLEFSSKMYLECRVNKALFKDYFKEIIIKWSEKIDETKTVESKEVYGDIKKVVKEFEDESYKPIETKLSARLRCISYKFLWVLMMLIFFTLLNNYLIYLQCFSDK